MTSRRSSGSRRVESAVEPTRSENITVTWRRSAVSLGALSVAREASDGGIGALASARKAAMASSSLRRSPTNPTPRSFKSSAVSLGRTVSSILFSRNAASYCSRPSLRSQPPRSMAAPLVRRPLHDPPEETVCLGNADDRLGHVWTPVHSINRDQRRRACLPSDVRFSPKAARSE
jgi:hypothetical protein